MTTDAAASSFPASWTEGPDIYVVFDDNRAGNSEIFFKHSADNGQSWSEDLRLTDAPGSSSSAAVVSSGENVHVVWQDARDGGSPEIYYKSSEDKGATWKTDTRLTNDTARSLLPCVAVADSVVHAVWEDTRDGNLEIYYKRNPTGNVGVEQWLAPAASRPPPDATIIIRGVLLLPRDMTQTSDVRDRVPRPVLLDISGRKVLDLRAGANDVRTLAPGVYFVRTLGRELSAAGCQKVVIAR